MQELDRWIYEHVFLDLSSLLVANDVLTDELRQDLDELEQEAAKAIKGRVLESYRNGQQACPTCNPRPKGRTFQARA